MEQLKLCACFNIQFTVQDSMIILELNTVIHKMYNYLCLIFLYKQEQLWNIEHTKYATLVNELDVCCHNLVIHTKLVTSD